MTPSHEQLINFCRTKGRRVAFITSDPDKRAEYTSLFQGQVNNEEFHIVSPSDQHPEFYFHMSILLDEVHENNMGLLPQEHLSTPVWTTLISIHSSHSESDYMKNHFPHHAHDTYVWNGTQFQNVAWEVKDRPPQSMVDPDEIFEVWPKLEQYHDDIYFCYAGACSEWQIAFTDFEQCKQEINDAFLAGKTKIVFYNGDETLQAPSLLKCQRIAAYFRDTIRNPNYTFFYVCANLQSEECYARLSGKFRFDEQMIVAGYHRFELLHKSTLLNNTQENIAEFNKPYEAKVKSKKFLSFNRVPRPHRMMLAARMFENGLVDKGYMSFDTGDYDCNIDWLRDYFNQFFGEPKFAHEAKLFNQFVDINVPMILNRSRDRDNPVEVEMDDLRYFRDSYFSIVLETSFYLIDHIHSGLDYDGVFLSEKAYKSFIAKHPFILLARPKSLQALRDLGYKTFSPWIDESYDDIHDDDTRMERIVEEVTRLTNLSDEEWLEIQINLAEIIEYNFNWLTENKQLAINSDLHNFF